MKTLLTFIACLVGLSMMAQVPPFIRNSFDTNSAAAAKAIVTNIIGGVLQRGSNITAGALTADSIVGNSSAQLGGNIALTAVGDGILNQTGGGTTVGTVVVGVGLAYDGTTLSASGTFLTSLKLTNNTVTPTAAAIGAGNIIVQSSNGVLFFFSSTDGSSRTTTRGN